MHTNVNTTRFSRAPTWLKLSDYVWAEIKYVAEIFFRGTNVNIPKGYFFKIINLMIGVFIQSFEFLTRRNLMTTPPSWHEESRWDMLDLGDGPSEQIMIIIGLNLANCSKMVISSRMICMIKICDFGGRRNWWMMHQIEKHFNENSLHNYGHHFLTPYISFYLTCGTLISCEYNCMRLIFVR